MLRTLPYFADDGFPDRAMLEDIAGVILAALKRP